LRASSNPTRQRGEGLFRSRRQLDDFSSEIDAHLELEAERLRAEGLGAAEARSAAFRPFGNVTRVRERFYLARRGRLWDQLRQDLTYAIGMLRRVPGFSLIAVATMALGVGGTTAIFSMVHATLLHPLPYPHPEQLVSLADDLPGVARRNVGMSVPEGNDLKRSGIQGAFAGVVGAHPMDRTPLNLTVPALVITALSPASSLLTWRGRLSRSSGTAAQGAEGEKTYALVDFPRAPASRRNRLRQATA
jgi:hypothetical protein